MAVSSRAPCSLPLRAIVPGRPARRARALALLAGIVLIGIGSLAPSARAQLSNAPAPAPNRYPPALPKRKVPPPPRLDFEIVATIALPGRLSGAAPVPTPDGALVPLDVGTARTTLRPGDEAALAPDAETPPGPAPDEANWVYSADRSRRFRVLPDGTVSAQKRCRRCRTGWRAVWSLRLPAAAVPPVVQGPRLLFGARDDRVYCVRADNGHRLWTADLRGRVSRPLALWSGRAPSGESLVLLLVATDDGGSLVALDPFDGSRVAAFVLPATEGRLATPPAAVDDGTVLIGRERYVVTDSDLLVLRLVPPRATAEPERPPASAGGHGKLRDRSGGG